MSPPAQERWVILAGVPKVVEDEEAERIFPPGADISVACSELPHLSVLTVPYRVSSPPCCDTPYVAAADSSGLLLLCSTEPDNTYFSIFTYHLCDARTGEAARLCEHDYPLGLHGRNVGLMMKGGSCMVAELRPAGDSTGLATLLCYTVGKVKWVEKKLDHVPPLPAKWYGEGVVSDGVMLWWVDLLCGLLACDPFADKPELLHVPLPPVPDQLPVKSAERGAYHCVRMSGGRLRYAVIHGSTDAPVLSTWALTDLTSDVKWNPERSISIADVWADESYLNTMLPWSLPALALIHPMDPDIVYFVLDNCIFSVDLRRKKVVDCSESVIPDQPREMGFMRSSHFVHAWQYDPSSSRSDFESSDLREEMENAARNRMIGLFHATRTDAKILKRYRDDLIREQQKSMRMKFSDWLMIPDIKT